MMPEFFVSGTDTDVGKTLVAAGLVLAYGAYYYKPVQSGAREQQSDTNTVQALARLPDDKILRPLYSFKAPLSPHEAAMEENTVISAARLSKKPIVKGALVVEGAGGLYSPFNKRFFNIDLIEAFQMPVVLVARSTLGTINHTLLLNSAAFRLRLSCLAARRSLKQSVISAII
jgi:dethiobiotin synthase